MRWTVALVFALFLSCAESPLRDAVHSLENVLLPFDPPLITGIVQSRAIRSANLPEGHPGKLSSARLTRFEIGNPDFPDLSFARSFRLFLVDTSGQMALVARADKVPSGQATLDLQPAGDQDLTRFLSQPKLDIVLEADVVRGAEQGVMLIGRLEFSYHLPPQHY